MEGFLPQVVCLLLFIVLFGLLNERVLHLTYEIALMLSATCAGVILLLGTAFMSDTPIQKVLAHLHPINIESFLLDGALCFMLFAGSCHIRINDFKTQARAVSVLAIITTILGALFYGLCFYGAALLFNLPFSLPVCLLFGSIIAPTDPIAATSILCNFGLPHRTRFLIEGESLLNDGVGVALFVCSSGLLSAQSVEGGDFFSIMLRQLVGAAVIGAGCTGLCFWVFMRLNDVKLRIFTSLLCVSTAYLLSQRLDCSGAIAAVVCGVLFATMRERSGKRGGTVSEQFDIFWQILDNLLNSILYVIMGLSFFIILGMHYVILISLIAIICNLVGRAASVYLSTFLAGPVPDGFSRPGFTTLLTWGGLRGGLCLALAMSARPLLSPEIFHMVVGGTYAIVFFTTVVQGLTMQRVYGHLKHTPPTPGA